jgi:putative membrane protein
MLWIKALHIIAMVAWMSALFYLPRLFVYHAQTEDEAGKARFKIMERRLYYAIATPAMLLTIIFGLWLLIPAWDVAYKAAGWMHAKLLFVVLLIGFHHMCKSYMRKFAADANTKSDKFYRVFNEVPTVLLILIVIMAVVKPF